MAAAVACPGLGRTGVLCAAPAAAASSSCAQRGAAAGRVALPCAFINSEVHASSSSITFSEGRSILSTVSKPVFRRRKVGPAVRGLFGLGVPELAVIAGVAALVFGPKQLPLIGKNLGKSVKSFQQAAKEFESEISKSKEPQAEVGSQKGDSTTKETPKTETITSTPIATSTKSETDTV